MLFNFSHLHFFTYKMEMKNTVRISLILRCIFFHILLSLNSECILTIRRSHIIDMFSFFLEVCKRMTHVIINGILDLMNYGIYFKEL